MPTLLLFFRMVIALAIVLGLVFVASRLLARGRGVLAGGSSPRAPRRLAARAEGAFAPRGRSRRPGSGWLAGLGLGATTQPAPIELVTRRALNKSSALVVVRAGERYLLLGTTAQSIALLAELSPAEAGVELDLEPAAPGAAGLHPGSARSDDLAAFDAVRWQQAEPTALQRAFSSSGPARLDPRHTPERPGSTPWTALQDEQGSTTAWDAFLVSLRERTVRR